MQDLTERVLGDAREWGDFEIRGTWWDEIYDIYPMPNT